MKANKSINDTPVIISGFKIGKYVILIIIAFAVFFIEYIPIAAAVPIIEAMTDDISASMSVFTRALMIYSL
jgi:CBS domain containing-hemolysin-like protein